MATENQIEAVKCAYEMLNKEYPNKLIVCTSIIDAARVAEYLVKYDADEIMLDSFQNDKNDEFVQNTIKLQTTVNENKPKNMFDEFLELFEKSNSLEMVEYLAFIKHSINFKIISGESMGDIETDIKHRKEFITNFKKMFSGVWMYNEIAIVVVSEEYLGREAMKKLDDFLGFVAEYQQNRKEN